MYASNRRSHYKIHMFTATDRNAEKRLNVSEEFLRVMINWTFYILVSFYLL